MKKVSYSPKRVYTLQELRYEKARVVIEMAQLEEELQERIHHYTGGGFLTSVGSGLGIFAFFEKWKIYFHYLTKGWRWIKKIWQKNKNTNETAHP